MSLGGGAIGPGIGSMEASYDISPSTTTTKAPPCLRAGRRQCLAVAWRALGRCRCALALAQSGAVLARERVACQERLAASGAHEDNNKAERDSSGEVAGRANDDNRRRRHWPARWPLAAGAHIGPRRRRQTSGGRWRADPFSAIMCACRCECQRQLVAMPVLYASSLRARPPPSSPSPHSIRRLAAGRPSAAGRPARRSIQIRVRPTFASLLHNSCFVSLSALLRRADRLSAGHWHRRAHKSRISGSRRQWPMTLGADRPRA